ncbi:hypothetical protein Afil01_58330 [Actinorhabdospora filicis]|uniref:Transposase n=1 Tax=Actinorhabdospora filicis TaxID=1785913 RepID=A0A9W6SUK6_9ACTN|nr:hypothetical protein [Actinorhabdospora filicis]GLZ81026.1 hypothetical protein Afil01_58330 [Actinorhabdospora filicis]
MRIYCGLATAGQATFAAIVDDAGRAVAVTALDDGGPRAFTALCALLAANGGGRCTPIASDDGSGQTPQLCTAAGHPVVVADEDLIGRFTRDDPAARQPAAQRALAAARALQTGAVTAIAGGAVRNLARLRPLLSSAIALAAGRATAVASLRGVLREVYPAALRAFDDPGDARPLAVLDALPEPAAAAYCQEDAVARELATAGLADTSGVIAALRAAAAEYAPSRRSTDEATRLTVRTAVSAVRVYDDGLKGLADVLTERLKPAAPTRSGRTRAEDLPPLPNDDAPKRRGIPQQRAEDLAPPVQQAPPAPPQQQPPQRETASPRESSRSAKVTPLPTRRAAREAAASQQQQQTTSSTQALPVVETTSGGFPIMGEPPVFKDPVPEPETVPGGIQLPPSQQPPIAAPAQSSRPLPIPDADDDGLTIFAQAKSAWFTGVAEDAPGDTLDWTMPTDEAWRSAQKTAAPTIGEQTAKGLPRRVPQANLVPGSALPEDNPPTPIERDPQALAANTAGYFRGWNRARRDAVDAAPVGANGTVR